jgi:hypothetical protein
VQLEQEKRDNLVLLIGTALTTLPLVGKTGWTPVSLSMLLASSRQMPIHGEFIVSGNRKAARLKQSDITLIELSGVLESMGVSGWRFAVTVFSKVPLVP